LTVLATVVSRYRRTLVIDAGKKLWRSMLHLARNSRMGWPTVRVLAETYDLRT